MKLTPKQRQFLYAAAQEGSDTRKMCPSWATVYYYRAGNVELREKWGDELRRLRLIEAVSDAPQSTPNSRPYRITDAGRAVITS